MKKSCSFFILDNAGAPVRQFTISRSLTYLLVIVVLGCGAWAGYLGFDYARLQQNVKNTHGLKAHIDSNRHQISLQHRQIQQFAVEINRLKSNLASLNRYEQKIRSVANLEAAPDRESRFGVGGSPPDDLNAKLPAATAHSSPAQPEATGTGSANSVATPNNDRLATMPDRIDDPDNLLAAMPSCLPVSGQPTGRRGPQTPATDGKPTIPGIDISVPQGTPIVATADGVVAFVGNTGAMGRTIVIDNGYGFATRYGNCRTIRKSEGDTVKRGETIAIAGAPGHASHVDVHYEILLNGVPINPDADLVSTHG